MFQFLFSFSSCFSFLSCFLFFLPCNRFSRQTEQLRNRHNDELTDCTASHQRKMDALRASLSQELSEFEIRERERRQDEILQSLRQELSQFEASQKDLFAKKREEVKKHVSDLTNESIEIDQQEIELAKKKAQLKSDFENQIESIQNDGEVLSFCFFSFSNLFFYFKQRLSYFLLFLH